ncbi:MAG: hypothetical protein IMZ57_11210 [Acidobacteria bacterium]|nr:hypothetical protein [Acidobacteriota bacterium]
MPFTPDGQRAHLIFLIDIEVCRRIDTATWTIDPINNLVWSTPCPEGIPSKVEANGTQMVDEGSRAGVQANDNSFCYIAGTPNLLYVHVLGDGEPIDEDPYLGVFHWRRYGTEVVEYSGHSYRPVLDSSSIPNVSSEIGGYHEGGTSFSFGSIKLLNGDGHFDALLDLYIWEAKRIVVRVGEKDKGDANYEIIFDGWTGNVGWGDEVVEINTEDARTMVS